MKIGVVIVTYNRKNELKKALELFDGQTCQPEYVMVINNASTDGTEEVLEQWKEKAAGYKRLAVHMESNAGGSGGFYEGLRRAREMDAEWIWVSDDDAFPESDALEQAEKYLTEHEDRLSELSAICGAVINQGKIDTEHRKRYYPKGIGIVEEWVSKEEYKKRSFALNAFSYVGTIISRQKLEEAGLTNKDYFIWWDDTEHSLRLSKVGKILCVPAIRIRHDVEKTALTVNWKTYYGFRNMTDMYRRHMPRVCYGYFCLKIVVKVWISKLFGWKKEEMRILEDAYEDVRKGRFGLHPVYRAGGKVGGGN